jgi:hypothetical protein
MIYSSRGGGEACCLDVTLFQHSKHLAGLARPEPSECDAGVCAAGASALNTPGWCCCYYCCYYYYVLLLLLLLGPYYTTTTSLFTLTGSARDVLRSRSTVRGCRLREAICSWWAAARLRSEQNGVCSCGLRPAAHLAQFFLAHPHLMLKN